MTSWDDALGVLFTLCVLQFAGPTAVVLQG